MTIDDVTFAVLVIACVSVLGLALGAIRVKGIGLGPAGVLFAGILFGHFGSTIHPEIAHFAKEFGLILFVFTMGIQLGPGIVQLWRQQGWVLNAMTFAIVLQGALIVVGFHFLLGMHPQTTAGLFCGATTNTPALGAAEQAIVSLETAEREAAGAGDAEGGTGESAEEGEARTDRDVEALATAYALAYPGGIVGIIASMLLVRRLFEIDTAAEARELEDQARSTREKVERASILVDNAHLDGTPFDDIPGVEETGVRISRVQRSNTELVQGATGQTELHHGDVVQVVGTRPALERFTPLVGRPVEVDLMRTPGNVEFRRIVVTEAHALNQSLRELSLDTNFHVTVTRIIRSGVEMTARGSSRFHFGDVAHVVGDAEGLDRVSKFLGNSTKSLGDTPFLPLFAGIAIGVVAGMIPIHLPGIPFAVKLGLAGGPLLAAILLSIVGNVGKLVWYIPSSANRALRELGIILFLACAGLGAGPSFFGSATSLAGLSWILVGITITMVPLLVTACLARAWGGQNYLTTCGVVAGSMTDPPALAFANSLADSEGCSTAYAAVYPCAMLLRILVAQSLVFLLR